MDASNVLKRAVIKSLGESVREIITVKTSRFQQITVAEIIKTALKLSANTVWQAPKGHQNSPQAENDKHVESREFLDKHIATLTKLFTISETVGSIFDEDDKVDYFRDSLLGHPILADILKHFDFEFPDCTTITYAQVCGPSFAELEDCSASIDTDAGKHRHVRRIRRPSIGDQTAERRRPSADAETVFGQC
jgi:hypothetical protein